MLSFNLVWALGFKCVEWSPLGYNNLGCVVCAVTVQNTVFLYEPVDNPMSSSWSRTLNVSSLVPFSSQALTVAWSISTRLESGLVSILATSHKNNKIALLLCDASLKFSSVIDVDCWVTVMQWSSVFFQNDDPSPMMFLMTALSDGQVVVYIVSIINGSIQVSKFQTLFTRNSSPIQMFSFKSLESGSACIICKGTLIYLWAPDHLSSSFIIPGLLGGSGLVWAVSGTQFRIYTTDGHVLLLSINNKTIIFEQDMTDSVSLTIFKNDMKPNTLVSYFGAASFPNAVNDFVLYRSIQYDQEPLSNKDDISYLEIIPYVFGDYTDYYIKNLEYSSNVLDYYSSRYLLWDLTVYVSKDPQFTRRVVDKLFTSLQHDTKLLFYFSMMLEGYDGVFGIKKRCEKILFEYYVDFLSDVFKRGYVDDGLMDILKKICVFYEIDALNNESLQDISEECPACQSVIVDSNISTAKCVNNHEWSRCMFSLKVIEGIGCLTCMGCKRKADADVDVRLMGNGSCLYCGSRLMKGKRF